MPALTSPSVNHPARTAGLASGALVWALAWLVLYGLGNHPELTNLALLPVLI